MFTGIVEAQAEVLSSSGGRLVIARPVSFDDVAIGASIAVSGACLTAVALDAGSMAFDVVPETRSKTTLGALRPGDLVNLERAMQAGGRFEGHILQGHVEGVGTVASIAREQTGKSITVTLPAALLPFVVAKGSITLDGVSLTVASVRGDRCSVAVIPHTLERTTLGALREGDEVNVETDIIGRYLLSLYRSSPPSP